MILHRQNGKKKKTTIKSEKAYVIFMQLLETLILHKEFCFEVVNFCKFTSELQGINKF